MTRRITFGPRRLLAFFVLAICLLPLTMMIQGCGKGADKGKAEAPDADTEAAAKIAPLAGGSSISESLAGSPDASEVAPAPPAGPDSVPVSPGAPLLNPGNQPLQPQAGPAAAAPRPGAEPNVNRDKNAALKKVRLPLYPGAKLEEGAIMGAPPGAATKRGSAAMVRLTTNDGIDKVVAFYKSRISGSEVNRGESEGTKLANVSGRDKKSGEVIGAQMLQKDKQVQVVLSRMPPPPKPSEMPFKTDEDKDRAVKSLDFPLYDGATVEMGATQTDRKNPAISRTVVVLKSPDSMDKVLAFYKELLPGAKQDEKSIEGHKAVQLISQDKSTGGGVSATVGSVEGGTRVVLIRARLPKPKGGSGS